jgi:hypothetical protein
MTSRAGARNNMGGEFLHPHVPVVIALRIIVRQVKISVLEQALGDEKIVRFVSGDRYASRDHERCPGVEEDDRREEKDNEPFSEGEGRKPSA